MSQAISQIIEVNEEGGLYLPPEVLGNTEPHTRYALQAQNGTLMLTRLEQEQPFWATATPEERAKAFREWALNHKGGPGLSDEMLRRENMYE